MALTIPQRLQRVWVRLEELFYWRERETVPVTGWTCGDEPIEAGTAWPSRDAVLIFSASAAVPAHWPISETRLILDPGGESLATLRGDGEARSFGVDPYHREFPVPAQQFGIGIESVARLPFGEPVRSPAFGGGHLAWIDLPVHAFHLRLKQVAEVANYLGGEHEAVPHLIAAAERAFHALSWPSKTETHLARFAPQAGQQRIWQLPPLIDNPPGLTDDERQSVIDADAGLVAELQALQERFPQQGTVALTGHAHIDLAWLWPYRETRRKMRRTFSTALSLMRGGNDYLANSNFVFNQSTAQYYAQMEEDDPELFKQIQQAAKDGRWEPVGGLWIEPDTNMPTGESLTRQVLYGQRYFEQKFGRRHTVCWLPDCFGFSGALPQLLAQGGITSFFTIKVNWNETNRIGTDLFWWEGIDGSRVLAHTFENPWHGYNGAVNAECIISTWRNFKDKERHPETLLAVGYGDGGGGVTPEYVEREVQLRDFPAIPTARWSRVEDFFARAHETAAQKDLSVWQGDIYLELHRGTLTTQSAVKKLHRQAERALITAETVGALAALMGAEMPPSLEPTWRVVLKNEFHDILPVSSIAEVYEDAERELAAAIDAAEAEQKAAITRLGDVLPAGDVADKWQQAIINPSLSERRWKGTTIPPLAVVVSPEPAADDPVIGTPTSLENAHLKVRFGEDGTISSLIHKASGREALAGRGNQIWVYPNDKPRNWDAWDIEDDYARSGVELIDLETMLLHQSGDAITTVRRFRNSRVSQTYLLRPHSRRLEIETRLDWHDRHCLVRTTTNVAVRTTHATFEHANGVVRRTTHNNTSWDQAQFEVPGHRFLDMSEPDFGVALLNDGKYGHSAKGNVLGMSLLRAPVYPDPTADEGLQSFTYALYPHAGEWYDGGVREEAEDLNQPLIETLVGGVAPGTYTPLAPSGISAALSGFKRAEDGEGLIFRVYEPAGARGAFDFTLPVGWHNDGLVSIMEEPMHAPPGLLPFAVRSWRLSRR